MKEQDHIAEGFYKIDDKYIEARPPQIKWGKTYLNWEPAKKIEYLEKFARSMNQAAYLVQKERNELNSLCNKKEDQINSLNVAMEQNMYLLQHEVTRMNEYKQRYNLEISNLNAKIRELENASNNKLVN